MVILAILAVSIGGPLTPFALRGDKLASRDDGAMISRESALIANNLLLVVATATVLIGTLYPLGLEAWERCPHFRRPAFLQCHLFTAHGVDGADDGRRPLLAWQRADGMPVLRRMLPVLGLVIVAVMITAVVTDEFSVAAMATIGLAIWLSGGVVTDTLSVPASTKVICGLPSGGWPACCMSRWGMNIAHIGTAVFILGAAGASFFEAETIERVFLGDVLTGAGNMTYRLERVEPVTGPELYQHGCCTVPA